MHLSQIFIAFCFSSLALAHGHKHDGAVAAAGGGKQNGTAKATPEHTGGGKKNGTTKATSEKVEGGKRNGTNKATQENSQCNEISRLTKLTDLVNNATKLTELETKQNLTSNQIDEIKAKAANATTRLTELKSNGTLVSQCAVIGADKQLKNQCKQIQRLTKLANLANNATALNELQTKRNLTTAQMEEIKSEAANATVKLQTLTGNATLTSSCQILQASEAAGGKRNKTGRFIFSRHRRCVANSFVADAATGTQKAARSVASSAAGFHVLGNGIFAAVIGVFAVVLMH
jgi:hypothetical protein